MLLEYHVFCGKIVYGNYKGVCIGIYSHKRKIATAFLDPNQAHVLLWRKKI